MSVGLKQIQKLNDMLRKVDRNKRETKTWEDGSGFKNENNSLTGVRPEGRFPANIILDEEAGKMLDEQSGVSKSSGGKIGGGYAFGKEKSIEIKGDPGFGDKGGASRFFYCAKSSKAERNAGLEEFEKKIDCDRNPKLDSANVPMNRSNNPKVNSHPTIKPLSLMRYLCNLTKTPTGGIILDPFAGSGSTLIAAIQTGRDYIGIEKEEEYIKIAEARIKYWQDKEAEKLL